MATPSNFYKNSVHAYARELDLSSVLENLHGRLPLEFLLSWDKFCMRNVCQSGQAVGDHSSGFRVLMCCHPFELHSNWLRVGPRNSLEGCILETVDGVKEIHFSYKPPSCFFLS